MKLVLERRDEIGSTKAGRLRRAGRLPAIAYGSKMEATAVSVPLREFSDLIKAGEHRLEGELDGKTDLYLIWDVQWDALGDHLLHADLRRVATDETVTTKVPIETVGQPKAGILERLLLAVPVICRADRIPERLMINISELLIGNSIRVRDLNLPEGVKPAVEGHTQILALHGGRAMKAAAGEEEEGGEGEEIAEGAEGADEGGEA